MFLKIKDIPVSQFMTSFPISVKSNVPFKTVVDFMSERGFGNLVVTEKEKPIGVFTEREVLKHCVSNEFDIQTPINKIGHQSFVIVNPGMSIIEAAKIMIEKKSRILVFADANKLVGIITPTDMLRAFRKTDDDPPIENFFSKNLAKCSHNNSFKDAVKIMYKEGIGSVLISDIAYYGIITERDILHLLKENRNLDSKINLDCSNPLINAEHTLRAKAIAGIMANNDIKRLGISNENKIIGIITALDLVNAYQSSSGSSPISHWNEVKG